MLPKKTGLIKTAMRCSIRSLIKSAREVGLAAAVIGVDRERNSVKVYAFGFRGWTDAAMKDANFRTNASCAAPKITEKLSVQEKTDRIREKTGRIRGEKGCSANFTSSYLNI